MNRRTVAVFTGSRAEYGLQYPILRAIDAHPELDYRLIVSGAHLDPDFGRSLGEIEADGFSVHEEVQIDLDEDTLYATAKAIGTGVVSMSQTLDRIRPDIMVVYGDRYEGFAALIAGTQMGFPTAHVEGGDLTEGGALDDSVRHAMTKLAHLHFTTNQQASNRILAMGEEPWRVRTVGFPAIDMIRDGRFAGPDELREVHGLDPDRPIVLFTQHSVATEFDKAEAQIRPSLAALGRLAADGVQVIVTYPNSDAGGRRIVAELEAFLADRPTNMQLHPSLGHYVYHGILALARAPGAQVVCAGNSSSIVKETPAFGCPAVNIGSRQNGRLRGENVIDADYDEAAIYTAIRRGLDDEEFRRTCAGTDNPYETGDAGIKIADTLARVELNQALIRKQMTLRGEVRDNWYR